MGNQLRKYAIIGCEHGHIASFIEEMNGLGFVCAGIYEPNNKNLAGSIAKTFGIPLVDDRERLLAEDIEFVGCAAINSEKIDIVELCEQHGKHVMVDKPLVTSRAGYDRLAAVVARGKIQIGMLLTERARPAFYTLKQRIDAGVLGDLVSIGMRKPHRLSPVSRQPWFFDKAQNGGIIIDLFIHDFDLLRWLTGKEIQSAHSVLGKNIMPEHPTFYDTAFAQVLMEGGITAQLYADWHTADKSWTWGDCRVFVTGTKGQAELRLAGDPLIGGESLYLEVTDSEGLRQVELTPAPYTLSGDLVRRAEGMEGSPDAPGHADLLAASLAVLEADERAEIVRSV